jgi:glycosyltransferase involved in cell wall biosynthesis
MESKPLVSVILDNYNYACFLSNAIDSVLNQTYENIEIIVVDDGSIDNSSDVMASYGDQIIPVLKQNGGIASALNAGFAASTGDIICLLDADDLFLPEKVARVVETFIAHPEIDWFFTESAVATTKDLTDSGVEAVFDTIRSKSSKEMSEKIDFRKNIENAELPTFTPSTSNLCFSRTFAEKIFPLPAIKGFSGMAITDLYIKLAAAGLGTGYATQADLGIYRIHNSFYTTLERSKKRRAFAEMNVTTGYWLKIKFPQFSKISKKLVSKGYAAYLHSKHLQVNSADADCEAMLQGFLADLTLVERMQIKLMIAYYFIKLYSAEFV